MPQRKFCAECGSNLPEVPTDSQREPRPSAGGADYGAVLAKVPARTRKVPACRNCGDLGWERAKREVIVPTAGNRTDELAARFVQRMEERGIPDLEITRAAANFAKGLHICVTKPLFAREEASMLVQFQQQGSDAILAWRHYELPGTSADGFSFRPFSNKVTWSFLLLVQLLTSLLPGGIFGAFGFFLLCGIGLDMMGEKIDAYVIPGIDIPISTKLCAITGGTLGAVGGAIFWWYQNFMNRSSSFTFTTHPSESSSLQLSVRAALDEAIDDANLSELVQELGSTDKKVI